MDQVQYTDPPREHFIKTALAKNKRFKLHVVATRGRNPLTSIARENNIIRVKYSTVNVRIIAPP